MFIEVKNFGKGFKSLINTDDISIVEETEDGCVICLREVADDFDKTKRQVRYEICENYAAIKDRLNKLIIC